MAAASPLPRAWLGARASGRRGNRWRYVSSVIALVLMTASGHPGAQQTELDELYCRAFPDDPQCRTPETAVDGAGTPPTPASPSESAPPVAPQPEAPSCPDFDEIVSTLATLQKNLAKSEQTIHSLDERVDSLLSESYKLYARHNLLCDSQIARQVNELGSRIESLGGLEDDLATAELLMTCVDKEVKTIEQRLAQLREQIVNNPSAQGELFTSTAMHGRLVDLRDKLTTLSQGLAYDIDKRERLNIDFVKLRSWCGE